MNVKWPNDTFHVIFSHKSYVTVNLQRILKYNHNFTTVTNVYDIVPSLLFWKMLRPLFILGGFFCFVLMIGIKDTAFIVTFCIKHYY